MNIEELIDGISDESIIEFLEEYEERNSIEVITKEQLEFYRNGSIRLHMLRTRNNVLEKLNGALKSGYIGVPHVVFMDIDRCEEFDFDKFINDIIDDYREHGYKITSTIIDGARYRRRVRFEIKE